MAPDLVPLNFVTSEDKYDSFAECFYQWKASWSSESGATPDGWEPEAQKDFEQINEYFWAVNFVEYLWLTSWCNGICVQGLFSFSGVVNDGVPGKTCAKECDPLFALNGDSIKQTLTVSLITIGVAWLVHLPLWFTFR